MLFVTTLQTKTKKKKKDKDWRNLQIDAFDESFLGVYAS